MNKKFKPTQTEELKELVKDFNINLYDIDTSLIINMSDLFYGSIRENYEGIETWDTSNVKNMSGMFRDNQYFNHDISKWNVSKVENMQRMFCRAKKFNQPLNIWDVSNVKDMSFMFYQCDNFNQLLNDWNVSNVQNMSFMFSKCRYFNQPLNNWNVSKVKDMGHMFEESLSFNQNLDDWNIEKADNLSYMFKDSYMFNNNCISLKFQIYIHCLGFVNTEEKENAYKIIQNTSVKELYKSAITSKNKKVILFCKSLENNHSEELEELFNEVHFNNVEEIQNYIEQNYTKTDEKKVKFINDLCIENIDIKIIKYIYLSYLELKRDVYRIKKIDNIVSLLDRESLINALKIIYTKTKKETSAIIYGIYGDDNALAEIYKNENYSKLLLIILSFHTESWYAVYLVCHVFRTNDRDDVQQLRDKIMENMIKIHNLSADELTLKTIPNYGFYRTINKDIDDKYKLILVNNEIELFDKEKNKILTSYPKNLNNKEEIKVLKKEIPNTIKRQKFNLVKLLVSGKKYKFSFFKEIFINNRLMNIYAKNLVWNAENKNNFDSFIYLEDGSFTNKYDEDIVIDDNSYVTLASPIEMDNETILKWKNLLNDYELPQPIMQFSPIKINDLNDTFDKLLNKLKNTKIKYGLFLNFIKKYEMKGYALIDVLSSNNSYFYDDINNQYLYLEIEKFRNNLKVDDEITIKPVFKLNDNLSEDLRKRFVYSWLIFMIWDFSLQDTF